MRFEHVNHYTAGPDTVLAMLTTSGFRDQVCAKQGALDHDVDIKGAGPGAVVLIARTQSLEGAPSLATKVVGDTVRIVQREEWRSATSSTLLVEIPGKPGALNGTIELAADGAGTVETVLGDIKVKIPLIGGKLEGLIGDLLASALRAEERVGRSGLAGQR